MTTSNTQSIPCAGRALDINRAFRKVHPPFVGARHMAACMSAKSKQHCYRLTLDLMRADQSKGTLSWPDPYHGACARPLDLTPTENRLWNGVSQADSDTFVSNFDEHIQYMEGFHKRWMPSNRAKNEWVKRVRE